MCEEGLFNLTCAIMEQAVKDYKGLLNCEIIPTKHCNINEVESFFRSEYFELMHGGNLTGDDVINLIRKQVENGN